MPDPITLSGLDAQSFLRPYLSGAQSVAAEIANDDTGATIITLTIS